jgi:type II secretory pathway pseudopilin PulG
MEGHEGGGMGRAYGLSRSEVIVVAAVIVLLLLLLLPSLGNIRSATRRTRCAANLRAQGIMLASYAAQHEGFLPVVNSPQCRRWLRDEPTGFTDELTAIRTATMPGLPDVRKEFYCPGNRGQNADTQWTETEAASDYRVLGYNYLNERLGMKDPLPTVGNDGVTLVMVPAGTPTVRLLRKLTGPGITAETEVAFDEIVSDAALKHDFVVPVGGQKSTTTSHLSGSRPTGGNVLGCDGHVTWRGFSEATGVSVTTPDGQASQWVPRGPAHEPIGVDVP